MPLWLAPSPNVVKLNVDAATSANAAYLAVVARDSSGSILNCWAKRSHLFLTPCITEASAIAWAIEIAKSENFQDIVVEIDTKVCIDAINGESARVPWKLFSLCINSKFLVLEFTSCSFHWVRRDAKLLTWWLTA
uniref:RNase H type-1 domain-containing protein n=1 Tax=Fagus sylvatica TaxID=28930 RepID=A0A2N9I849_FAGSY